MEVANVSPLDVLSYERGAGHVLTEGHEQARCTACAWDAGRQVGRLEEADAWRVRVGRVVAALAATHKEGRL